MTSLINRVPSSDQLISLISLRTGEVTTIPPPPPPGPLLFPANIYPPLKIEIAAVPEKPGLPIAVEKDKTSIKLQWEPGHDGYAPIRQYTVMYR